MTKQRSAHLTGLLLAVSFATLPPAASAQLRPGLEKPGVIRVCADPDNMPLSNQKGEGFEQKIAELVAKEWNAKVEYAWWPVRRGFFARALNGRYCDIAIQAPADFDMAGVTKPYFRSGYVFVTRKDSGLDIKSLADPRLKKLKIGVNILNSDAENTPPAMALSRYGVVGNLTGFPTFYTDSIRPEDIVNAVAKKDIDVAIAWGPLAGYFANKSSVPLTLQPLAERDSLTRFPLPLQHRYGSPPARSRVAGQPANRAGPQGTRDSGHSEAVQSPDVSDSSRAQTASQGAGQDSTRSAGLGTGREPLAPSAASVPPYPPSPERTALRACLRPPR